MLSTDILFVETHCGIDGCVTDGQIYGANSTQMLYSLSDDDTNSTRLPVTQIRFLSSGDPEQPTSKFEHVLSASCESHVIWKKEGKKNNIKSKKIF